MALGKSKRVAPTKGSSIARVCMQDPPTTEVASKGAYLVKENSAPCQWNVLRICLHFIPSPKINLGRPQATHA